VGVEAVLEVLLGHPVAGSEEAVHDLFLVGVEPLPPAGPLLKPEGNAVEDVAAPVLEDGEKAPPGQVHDGGGDVFHPGLLP